jgi:hypothetical protein
VFVKLFHQLSLLVNEQFRISDDVDEQNVRDLEARIGRFVSRHMAGTPGLHAAQAFQIDRRASSAKLR